MLNKKLILFFLTIHSQIYTMDKPFHVVFGNKDLVQQQIVPHCTISSVIRLKQVCKGLDGIVVNVKEIVLDRLKNDYILFFDFYNPPAGLSDDQLHTHNTDRKIQLLDALIPIHEKSIKEDIACYRKLFYKFLIPYDSTITPDTMKAFVLGEDISSDGHLLKQPSLYDVCEKDNYSVTLKFLDKNIKHKHTITELLSRACHKHRSPNAVKALLKRGADPNAVDTHQRTPLYWACLNGCEDIVEELLKWGADPNETNQEGYVPFVAACTRLNLYTDIDQENNNQLKRIKIVDLLLQYGFDLNHKQYTSPFVIFNCASIIPTFLKYGISPNLCIAGHGRTLFHAACKDHETKAAQACLDKGALVNLRDNDGNTPLHLACYRKTIHNLKLVELLLKNGADVNQKNNDNCTPLYESIILNKPGALKVIQLLLVYGADPNISTEDYGTALDLVNREPTIDEPLKDLLLQHGARTRFYLFFTHCLQKATFILAIGLTGITLWYSLHK